MILLEKRYGKSENWSKEYTQEELYLIGKEHYPRYYYIFLYFGIIFFFPSLFVEFVIGVITIILYNVMEKDFPIWAFYIPLGVFGFFALTGLIFMIEPRCSVIQLPSRFTKDNLK